MRRAIISLCCSLSAVGCLNLDEGAYRFGPAGLTTDAGATVADCARACVTPPARRCVDSRTLEAFPTSGRCTAQNGCGYNPVSVACAVSCVGGACTGEPCAGTFCDAPPAPICGDSTHVRVFSPSGQCAAGNCSYSSTLVECPLGCLNGACGGNACVGKSCTSPPPSTCLDASALRTFVTPGSCSGGKCAYSAADLTCARGCSNGACVDDPCVGRVCDQPPANACRDATTKRLFISPGTCEREGSCRYATSEVACPSGQLCSAGACVASSCALNNGGCDPHATCREGVPTRTCACNAGYAGDGLHCSAIDAGSGGACNPSNCAGCCNGTQCVAKADFTNFQCGSGTPGGLCTSCTGACNLETGTCGSAEGAVRLTWRFPGNRSCAEAVTGDSISVVTVSVDGQSPVSLTCTSGLAGGAGVSLSDLTVGMHDLELHALSSTEFEFFAVSKSVQVKAGQTLATTLDFAFVVGALPLKWRFTKTGVTKSCAALGNPSVYLNFKDDQGRIIYPGAGVAVSCVNTDQVQGAVFPYFPSGNFEVFVQAVGSSNVLYTTDQLSPPVASVTAAVFPPLDAGVTYTVAAP